MSMRRLSVSNVADPSNRLQPETPAAGSAAMLRVVPDADSGGGSGLRWYELEWLDPGGTGMGGRVGDRAGVGAGWASASCSDWILAAPFRAHVGHLMSSHRLAWRTVALLAGVPAAAMERLMHGRNGRPQHRVHPVLARRLLQLADLDVVAAGVRLMPADLCGAALKDLLHWGWTCAVLADRTRLPRTQLAATAEGRQTECTRLVGATTLAAAQALRTRTTPDAARPADPMRSALVA